MRKRKKLPTVLEEPEQKKLLSVPNKRYKTGHRNYVMIKLMLNTGLRLSEIINLKWKHINQNKCKLKVVEGKGAKDRFLCYNDRLNEELQEWENRQTEEIGEQQYLFTTMSKNNSGNKLSQRYVQQMLKRYTEKAEIDKNISPHTLRHTFATDFYSETKDIRKTQKALGHADLSTTMIYTHIVDDELEKAMRNFRKNRNE